MRNAACRPATLTRSAEQPSLTSSSRWRPCRPPRPASYAARAAGAATSRSCMIQASISSMAARACPSTPATATSHRPAPSGAAVLTAARSPTFTAIPTWSARRVSPPITLAPPLRTRLRPRAQVACPAERIPGWARPAPPAGRTARLPGLDVSSQACVPRLVPMSAPLARTRREVPPSIRKFLVATNPPSLGGQQAASSRPDHVPWPWSAPPPAPRSGRTPPNLGPMSYLLPVITHPRHDDACFIGSGLYGSVRPRGTRPSCTGRPHVGGLHPRPDRSSASAAIRGPLAHRNDHCPQRRTSWPLRPTSWRAQADTR